MRRHSTRLIGAGQHWPANSAGGINLPAIRRKRGTTGGNGVTGLDLVLLATLLFAGARYDLVHLV
jgi:hypothetical protein